jgi:hypothetical protein
MVILLVLNSAAKATGQCALADIAPPIIRF